ncbi:hypothetical protein Pve01_37800 [Planomonospora venezuelensis]|nr:hypothetical protein Pve01_37800 [Planomonospora venezuelensis]
MPWAGSGPERPGADGGAGPGPETGGQDRAGREHAETGRGGPGGGGVRALARARPRRGIPPPRRNGPCPLGERAGTMIAADKATLTQSDDNT